MRAPHVQNISKDVEEDIRLILKTWDRLTPNHKKFEFIQYVSSIRRQGSEWSQTKQLLHVAELPSKIYHMMAQWFRTEDGRPHYEWRNDPAIMPVFIKAVKAFRINTSTEPMMMPEKIEEDYERNKLE